MKLRDRLGASFNEGSNMSYNNNSSKGGSHSQTLPGQRPRIQKACKRYNRGRCKFGQGCRYEHKCSYCGKFGHTILTCRKLTADKERAASFKKEKDSPKE